MREKTTHASAPSLATWPSRTLSPNLLAGGAIALTLARWLVPTEATAEGETLWIAGLWFAVGAVVCCFGQSNGTRRWDAVDLAAGLLIGGHVLSGLIVICGVGDRRAALNLLWEWLSLGVFWIVWRELLRWPAVRRAIVPVLLVTAVTISLWGLWQYFVWYPVMQAKLGPLFDQARAGGANAAAARQQLQEAGVPVDGPAMRLFENRLRNSREPFGPFALANTLGGLLAAWLVVGIGALIRNAVQKSSVATRGGSWIMTLYLVPIALCLYLTNSRTAWVGVIAAGCAAAAVWWARRFPSPRIRQAMFPIATVLGLIVAGAVFLVIARDEHSVPGPLKSLAYRAEYWTGTWRLLMTAPLEGAGLGQFRDKYLAFKLPETSEEIADPHNLLLDVWANGGFMALVGLLGLLAIAWHRAWRFSTSTIVIHPPSPPTASAGPLPPASWIISGLAAFGLTILGPCLITGVWDEHADRLAIFAVAWFAAAWLFSHCGFKEGAQDGSIAWFAVIALSIHLLGAGGMAMPAVTQLWLLLFAWGLSDSPDERPIATTGIVRLRKALLGSGCVLLCAACFWSGVVPVARVKRDMAEGDAAWMSRGDASRAERAYRRAAQADTWSKDPWERLAELEFSRAMSERIGIDLAAFEAALRAADEAVARAPDRVAIRLRTAEMRSQAARRTGSSDDWQAAALAYRDVEPRYAINAQLHADYAVALSQAGDTKPAADQARRALDQDDLNHRRGHADRYLTEAMRRELESLAAPLP